MLRCVAVEAQGHVAFGSFEFYYRVFGRGVVSIHIFTWILCFASHDGEYDHQRGKQRESFH